MNLFFMEYLQRLPEIWKLSKVCINVGPKVSKSLGGSVCIRGCLPYRLRNRQHRYVHTHM